MLKETTPVQGTAVRERRRWNPTLFASAVPIGALLPGKGEPGRFLFWDFTYHDAFHLRDDGSRLPVAFCHWHPHFEIFFIRKGSGLLRFDTEVVEVKPRMLVIVRPGDIHCWLKTDHVEGTLLTVSEPFSSQLEFSGAFDDAEALYRAHSSRTIELGPIEANLIESAFQAIACEPDALAFQRPDLIRALLLVILGSAKGAAGPRGRQQAGSSRSPLTLRFERALLSEFPRLTSVKEMAEFLGTSRSYLHRTVMRDLGTSPSDLIRERTLYESKRMLLQTGRSLGEVAQALRFTSASGFASFFRRHTRLSPRSFRSHSSA